MFHHRRRGIHLGQRRQCSENVYASPLLVGDDNRLRLLLSYRSRWFEKRTVKVLSNRRRKVYHPPTTSPEVLFVQGLSIVYNR